MAAAPAEPPGVVGGESSPLAGADRGQGSQSECDAKSDSAGVRIRQHRAVQNERTRCHPSGCSGFFETCASYQNCPAVPVTKSGKDASFSNCGGWHLFHSLTRLRLEVGIDVIYDEGMSDERSFPRLRPSVSHAASRRAEIDRIRRMTVEERVKAALGLGARFAALRPSPREA